MKNWDMEHKRSCSKHSNCINMTAVSTNLLHISKLNTSSSLSIRLVQFRSTNVANCTMGNTKGWFSQLSTIPLKVLFIAKFLFIFFDRLDSLLFVKELPCSYCNRPMCRIHQMINILTVFIGQSFFTSTEKARTHQLNQNTQLQLHHLPQNWVSSITLTQSFIWMTSNAELWSMLKQVTFQSQKQ